MDNRRREFIIGKMWEVWSEKYPGLDNSNLRILEGPSSEVRNHGSGVYSIQCGASAGYVFDLRQKGVQERYQEMLSLAERGILSGTELLIGLLETCIGHGIEDNFAYLITSARSPREHPVRD